MSDELIDELPVLQRLALSYAPGHARQATLALLALDARLAGIVRRGQEPALAQLRLAWWRDVLAKPVDQWPKGDAVLAGLRDWVDPSQLGPLVDGWEMLLAESLGAGEIEGFSGGRGAAFSALAEEVGSGDARDLAHSAARGWALADLAANLGSVEERDLVLRSAPPPGTAALPRSLRPLAVLEGLGRRSLEKGGAPLLDGPLAGLVAIRLGITGR